MLAAYTVFHSGSRRLIINTDSLGAITFVVAPGALPLDLRDLGLRVCRMNAWSPRCAPSPRQSARSACS